jgi:hypothetical protein
MVLLKMREVYLALTACDELIAHPKPIFKLTSWLFSWFKSEFTQEQEVSHNWKEYWNLSLELVWVGQLKATSNRGSPGLRCPTFDQLEDPSCWRALKLVFVTPGHFGDSRSFSHELSSWRPLFMSHEEKLLLFSKSSKIHEITMDVEGVKEKGQLNKGGKKGLTWSDSSRTM